MSRENVDSVLDAYRRFNAGETRPELWFWHEDAEYHVSREDPDSSVRRGIDGIREQFASWIEAYPDLKVEPLEARDAGDVVFIWVRFSGHGGESGMPMEMELAHVITMRDGRADRLEEYFDRAEALKAAGLERAAPLLSAVHAFNEGGVEAALEFFDPNLEWVAPPEWLEDQVYGGHEGLRRLSTQWTHLFDDYQLEPVRSMDVGEDQVVLLLQQRGRIRGSGDPVESPIGYVAEIREGLVARVSIYFSWEATLEAAGITE